MVNRSFVKSLQAILRIHQKHLNAFINKEDNMDLITALAVIIGIMGGLATWAAITIASTYILIWTIFVAWGSFYHCGGKVAGLKSSAAANVWGVICAVVALVALTSIGVTAVMAGICVGISIVVLIMGAKISAISAIPSAVYGYASTAALFLLGAAAYGEGPGAIIKVGVAVAVSLIVGNILGFISEKIVGSVVKA
jgi:Protein of unknown function (DUF1097)